jgi:hypothetical protein
MNYEKLVCFIAKETNSGPVTFGGRVVELKRDGKPLRAGDLIAGNFYEFDRETGELKNCPHGYRDWDDCPDCRH